DSGREGGPAARRAALRAPGHDRQAVLRPDRRHLADLQAVAGDELQAVALEDPRGDDPDLGLAEAHPDAGARAAAEGDVGALGDLLPVAGREALGAESLGLVPDVGQ